MARNVKGISLKKIVSYSILFLFLAIIIIAFTVPQYMNNSGENKNIIAVVNGETVYKIELNRFANNMLRQYGMSVSQLNDQMMAQVEQMFISSVLQRQLAKQQGIEVSDNRVKSKIREYFTDQNGVYSKKILEQQLKQNNMTYPQLHRDVESSIASSEFNKLLYYGNGASPDEIKYADIVKNSQFSFKYVYISNNKIRDLFKNKITVTEQEINKKMAENPDEIKDPKSDKARIRQTIFKEKLDKAKKDFITKINTAVESEKSLKAVADLTETEVKDSNVFKIGEKVTENNPKGRSLEELVTEDDFYDSFITLNSGAVSKVIEAGTGLYVFSPSEKNIVKNDLDDTLQDQYMSSISGEKVQASKNKIFTVFMEESTINRNK